MQRGVDLQTKKASVLKANVPPLHPAASSDLPSLQRAQACCRGILQAVNEVVGETEHRQRLSQYQRRLDAAPQFKVERFLLPYKFCCIYFIYVYIYLVSDRRVVSYRVWTSPPRG